MDRSDDVTVHSAIACPFSHWTRMALCAKGIGYGVDRNSHGTGRYNQHFSATILQFKSAILAFSASVQAWPPV